MKRKLILKSSCVSDSKEYINSQPVAERGTISQERQRGTVILTRYSRGNSQGNYYSPAYFIEQVFYIYKKNTVTLLYHVETFPVNTVHRQSTKFPYSASYLREQIKYLTFAELMLPVFLNKPQVKGYLKNGLGFY